MKRHFLFTFIAFVLAAFMATIPVSGADLQNMTDEERAAYMDSQPRVVILSDIDPAHMPPGSDIPCQGECVPLIMVFSPGDKVRFHGENTASDTTYFFIIGPGLDEKGAQIMNPDPAASPVESGNAATFARASVGGDHKWSWTWDTTGTALKDGTYEVIAASHPNGFDTGQAVTARGYYKITFKNPSGTTTSATAATPTTTTKPIVTETIMPGVVTIMGSGDLKYFAGDEITFSGKNTAGWKTYLFITGPGLDEKGAQIQSNDPKNSPVEDGNAATFKQMDVQGDRTWSWKWGTANTKLEPGTYTIYAVAQPNDKVHLEKIPYGTVSITIRKAAEPVTPSRSPISTTTTSPSANAAPNESPGFGALVALAGLGSVAMIVKRRV